MRKEGNTMASPYGHYAEILEDILKELQKEREEKPSKSVSL